MTVTTEALDPRAARAAIKIARFVQASINVGDDVFTTTQISKREANGLIAFAVLQGAKWVFVTGAGDGRIIIGRTSF